MAALALCWFFVGVAPAAGSGLVFGPKNYVRSRGAPVVVTDTFDVTTPGAFALRIDNGGANGQFGRVSSAVITLNGLVVVGPSDFNQQVAVIQRTVALQAHNVLSVELRSAPNSGLTLQISGLNTPPVANAGPDQTVTVGTTVTLDGSRSTDADGDSLTFRWQLTGLPDGSAATLSNPTAMRPTFVVDRPGTYVAELVVNDGTVDSAPDTVQISTENSRPVANAGPDQTVTVGTTVTLDGSASTDIDGDPLTFRWVFTALPSGSAATLSDPTAVRPTFVVDRAGAYTVQLVVNDGALDSIPDTVNVSTVNSRPVANAGPDQVASVGDTVHLDGSGSSDADGDPLTYRWSFTSKPDGSVAVLSGADTVNPAFVPDVAGLYVVQLIVNDGTVDSLPDTATVTVQVPPPPPPTNHPPVAVDDGALIAQDSAGVTLTVLANDSDPDGDPISIVAVTQPANGTVTNTSSTVTYTPKAGFHGIDAFTYTITDGRGGSATGTVRITIDQPPFVDAGPDQTVTLPAAATLAGTVTDDGLPAPPGAVTAAWSTVSGPGSVAFGDASAPRTTATFSVAGDYVLRLTADDGFLSASADVRITVSAAATAAILFPPVITSTPVTSATIGGPYLYDVQAIDPDVGDVLTFSLVTAPTGMTIDAATGRITWTPSPGQNGPNQVGVRVLDKEGAFATQGFTIDVRPGAGNRPPAAVDDAYEVRIGESLGVPAPGVLANDSDPDGDKLSAVLVTPPENGTLAFNSDGSFVYTPDTIMEGDFVSVAAANLGRFVPGVTVNVSSKVTQPGIVPEPCDPPDCGLDDLLGTSWVTASGDAANLGAHPFYEVVFPSDQTVSQLQVVGHRDGFLRISKLFILAGEFQLFDADGNVLFDSGVVALPAPEHDVTVDVPNVSGVRRARITSTSDQTSQVGFAEFRVIGPTFLERSGLNVVVKYHALADIPGDFGINQHGVKVISTPMVAHLTDDNGDGKIDDKDLPAIVFATMPNGQFDGGAVMALRGTDGHALFTAGAPNQVATLSEVAVGVIDGTGLPTIIAAHSNGQQLIAFDNTGATKWLSGVHALPGRSDSGGAISIANLDGSPKIVIGASVYDANGRFLADGRDLAGTSGFNSFSAISAVADVDLDGVPEIIAGPTAYRFQNGQLTKVWQRTDRPDGFVGIARFGDDPRAQIVVVGNGVIYMLNADGTDPDFWNPPTHAPVPIPGGGAGGAPTIADMDGDGIPEIGVAAADRYTVFKRDGSVLWSSPTQDVSSNATGSTVFDFNQDGTADVIYRDEQFLRIYRGKDGQILFQRRLRSGTATEQPVVADVANDGHAKIIVPSDNLFQAGFTFDDTGIYVLEDIANKWGRTRGIWNQHSYHVTNVNDDGTIPPVEQPNWLVPGLNNFRLNAFIPGQSPDQADTFTYKATDGALESNEATVRITIRQPNTPPSIVSAPVVTAATNVPYLYAVRATDPDPGDVLTFSLPLAPAGMTIDPSSGLIKWTPNDAQAGAQSAIVRVQDAHGAFAVQGYTVQVGSPATVPNVVGQTQADAQATITTASLTLGAVNPRASATVLTGTVIAQNPLAGTLAAPGSPISIDVSTGPPPPPPPGQVPGVVGEAQADAQADIVAAGFTVGAVGNQNDFVVPPGFVLSQNPTAGTLAQAGSPVSVVVSLGPAHVPNVVGKAQSAAAADITSAGFVVGTIVDQNSASAPAGVVITQDPVAGAAAPAGAPVNLAVSIGPGVPGDTTPPTVGLDLVEGTIITIPTDITGAASDVNFLRYALDIARVDSDRFTRIASGTAPVTGVLGRVDPTLLENGLYRLRLTAEDVNAQISVDERVVRIEGMAKVGNFRLSFTDLSVPVAGIPITIVRTYDSRVKTQEDFGVGWTLDVKRGFYEHNRTPGEAWQILPGGGILPLPCQTVSETALHLTQVRLSDYESYTFALTLSDPHALTGGCEATASFRFVDGRRPGATLEILDGTDVFYLNGDSQVVYEDTFLVYNPSKVRLTTADGRVFDLERGVGITRIQDLNGNTLTITPAGIVHSSGKSIAFTRDDSGRITRITDPNGHTLAYGYDANGDLVSFTDQASNQTTFTYDGRHDLLEVVDPLGRRPVRSEYDSDGRLIAVIDTAGNRTAVSHDLDTRQEVITDRLGQVSVVEYDERGNIVRRTDPLGNASTATYDQRDNKLAETDALGNTRTYMYDARDNVLTERDALGNATSHTYNARNQELTRTDARGGTLSFGYDTNGNLVAQTDQLGKTTVYAYDSRGNQLSKTDPLGNQWTYAYDASGHRIQTTDPLGNVTERTFDATGNKITETTRRVTNGTAQAVTFAYGYDGLNRLVSVTVPEGGVTQRSYTPTGALASTTDPLGRVIEHSYDEQGRLIALRYPDATTETLDYDLEGRVVGRTDRAGRATRFVYDAAGRLITTTYPGGAAVQTGYDAAGRPVTVTDENGNTVTSTYDPVGRRLETHDALGNATAFTYDGNGNRTTLRDPLGHTTSYTYDAANRRTRIEYADGTARTTTYDDAGRVSTETDQAGQATQYGYDARGRLASVTDALGQVTRYAYDELGNLVAQTDAAGSTTRFEYDGRGRRTRRTLPLGQVETFTYDLAGNVTSRTDFRGQTTAYVYDSLNRLIAKTSDPSLGEPTVTFSYTPTGRRATMADASGTTAYAYDDRDRLLSKATPQGTLTYVYDPVGNLVGLRSSNANGAAVDYAYDAANRLTSLVDRRLASGTTAYTYDAGGNVAGVTAPNGVATAYSYDALNRRTGVAITRDASTLAGFGYTLGPAGNTLRVDENDGRTVTYDYDSLYRLTAETIAGSAEPPGNGAVNYTYDAASNRLERISTVAALPSATSSYDANDGLVSDAYDGNGNTTAAGSATYAYDFENRITSLDGGAVTFLYDGDGNRVAKTVGGLTTRYLIDDRNPTGFAQVLEEKADGSTLKTYTYGHDLVSQRAADGATSFYGYDGRRSVRLLTDLSGRPAATYRYDAFGNLLEATGSVDNVYRYAGEQFDPDLNLMYLRARYLDPATGRFRTMDPHPGVPTRPITLNRYLYGNASPVDTRDPSGKEGLLEAAGAAAIVGVLVALPTHVDAGLVLAHAQDWQAAQEVVRVVSSDPTFVEVLNLYSGGFYRTVFGGVGLAGTMRNVQTELNEICGLVKTDSDFFPPSKLVACDNIAEMAWYITLAAVADGDVTTLDPTDPAEVISRQYPEHTALRITTKNQRRIVIDWHATLDPVNPDISSLESWCAGHGVCH